MATDHGRRHRKDIATLPAPQRAYERFRAYLAGRGFSSSDIDDQIKLIQSQAARSEAERWNCLLTTDKTSFNTQPNEFLVEMASVTGFDPAEKAVALAQQT